MRPPVSLLGAIGIPAASFIGIPTVARAQYATPPEEPLVVRTPDDDQDTPPGGLEVGTALEPCPHSTVRLATGPAARIGNDLPLAGGVGVAVDVGRRAAGTRLSGAWLGVGRQTSLAQYVGELWLDLGYGHRLHPVLGAGGGVAQLAPTSSAGESNSMTLGIGTLRLALQYSLPVRDADARAGVAVIGSVPAAGPSGASSVSAWLVTAGTVVVGF